MAVFGKTGKKTKQTEGLSDWLRCSLQVDWLHPGMCRGVLSI